MGVALLTWYEEEDDESNGFGSIDCYDDMFAYQLRG